MIDAHISDEKMRTTISSRSANACTGSIQWRIPQQGGSSFSGGSGAADNLIDFDVRNTPLLNE